MICSMSRPLPLLVALALTTSLTCPRLAAAQTAAETPARLSQDDLVPDEANRIYAQAVGRGDLPAVMAHLDALARTGPARQRATVALLRARLFWRMGDRESALAAVDASLAIEPGLDGDLARAELLDAQGAIADAITWYRKARAIATAPAVQRRIDLRLAILAAVRRPDTLQVFAAGKPPAEARHLADILELLGRPKAALDLARAAPGDGVVDALKKTQWALSGGDAVAARDFARKAFAVANGPDDQRYALALLIEACRAAGDLSGALADLDRLPQGSAVSSARVDVLLELGRIHPAITAIEQSTSPELRRRLPGVLDLAGDPSASETEYRRLIAADPHQADLYARLAALYLTRGDEAQAVATYRTLFAANRGRADVLTAGAKQMIAMGLEAQAVTLLQGSAGDPTVATATHQFLFETYLDRGDIAKALAELTLVEQGDPRGALLAEVADGYERLGRPDAALTLLHRLEAQGRSLGYDDRVRIAQLAATTGHDEEALTRWRALWSATSLPARRSYIERQIVALARKMDRLEPLAQEISARLDGGTIRPGEIDLLVVLRLAQGKADAAADAVRRFAARTGASEVVVLNQLAQLYARVRDYDRVDATLRRLVTVDPGNRDTHIRQLILSMLRHEDGAVPPAQRQADLDRLIAQLSENGEAGGHAFKATVYAEASLDAQAIAQLRQGQAANPDDGDALLRLATELKRQHRPAEAIGLLQYAVEHGGTPVFLSAIDGLVDMVADASGGDGVLLWAERMVLERIAAEGTNGRLLGLLADIAAADADYDLQLRSIEASVPAAGEQRAFVLRELAALSGGGNGEDGATALIGEPRRKLIYARRLLALGRSFPPDLYADLARTLLTQGDEAGAERAFAMMSGMGGLVNVDEAKGDAYAAADRPAQALTNYGRALLQDQTNLDLLVKTSILRERAGEDALAWRWYARGLRVLLGRQPLTPLPAGDERELDARRFYRTIVEGLLLTWPNDASATTAILADLQQRFAIEMARLDPAHAGGLADHPRLALLVDLGHRIVDAGKGDDAIVGWDAVLDRSFADDAAYQRSAALRRHLTGRGGAAVVPATSGWPLPALRLQSVDVDNPELGLVLALATGDLAGARALLASALANEEAARDSDARQSTPTIRESVYIVLLADAMDQMPPARFREMALAPLLASKVRDGVLFDIFRAAPDRFSRLESIAGTTLLAPDALVHLTITQSNRSLGVSLRVSRRSGGGGLDWLDHFTTDQLIALYEGLLTRLVQGEGDSMLSDVALAGLFHRSLNAGQKNRIAALLDRDIGVVRDPKLRSGAPLVGRLLRFDALPANREMVLRAAHSVASRYPDSVRLPTVLEHWYAGDKQQALVDLAGLGDALRTHGQSTQAVDQSVAKFFPDIHRQQIAAFLADPQPEPKVAAAVYQRFAVDDGETTSAERMALTRKMILLDPANPVYRDRLLSMYAEKEDWGAFTPALQAYVDGHRDDRLAATMLAMVYRVQGQPEQAAAVARLAEVDPDDADWLVRLLNRSRAMRGRGIAGLFGGVYEAYLRHDPKIPAVIAVEARQGRSAAPVVAGDDATLSPLLLAEKAQPGSAPSTLRALWRNSAAVPAEGEAGRGRRALVYTLAAATRGHGAGADLLARADMSVEIQRYPGVMAPEEQARQQPLYDVIAFGSARRGQGITDFGAMLADLRAGRADADERQRILALANRLVSPLSPADLAALDRAMRATPVTAAEGRLVLARVYARSGDLANAEAFLKAGFLQMLYPTGPLDGVEDLSNVMGGIVDIVATWPNLAERRRVYGALAQILEKRKLGPNGGDLPDLPPLVEAAGG